MPTEPKGILFDGTDDYLDITSLTGIADSKVGLVSLWFKLTDSLDATRRTTSGTNVFLGSKYPNTIWTKTDGNTRRILATQAARFTVALNSVGRLHTAGQNASGTSIFNQQTKQNIGTDGWTHVMASWNLGTGASHMYVNGYTQQQAVTTLTDDSIDYTNGIWTVGALNTSGTVATYFPGSLSELYFANEYLDLSDADNREKFIDVDAVGPVSLGSDGSTPTGTQPLIYLQFATSSALGTNSGSGGDFTVNGSPTQVAGPFPVYNSSATHLKEGRGRWYECDYCHFTFQESDTRIDYRGLRACTTGPSDFDEDPRKQPKQFNPLEFVSS
jgi:hypothetical protein